jgi:hypothetical protein
MSLTYIGLIVAVLGRLLQSIGIPATTEDLTTFITVGAQIIGGLVVLWGRYRQGDIDIFGRRI